MTPKTEELFRGRYYLVAGDGSHCYPLQGWLATHRLVMHEGWKLIGEKRTHGWGTDGTCWLVTPGAVTELELKTDPIKTSSGYVLKDPAAASARFPSVLMDEEWVTFGFDDPDTDDGYMASRLYKRQVHEEPQPPEVVKVDLEPMPGEMDPYPDLSWSADQPDSLVYSSCYHHLLPGRASGFRKAVFDRLKAELGESAWFDRRAGVYDHQGRDGLHLEVTLQLPYSTPKFRQQPTYGTSGRKLKATRTVEEFMQIRLPVPVADVITGPHKAQVGAYWERTIEEIVAWVKSHQVKVCASCGGRGSIADHPEKPAGLA